jgi:hypothetical protein
MSTKKANRSATRQDVEDIVSGAVQEVLGAMSDQFAKRDKKINKIDDIGDVVSRIENKLDPTIEQVDDHEARIKLLEQQPA